MSYVFLIIYAVLAVGGLTCFKLGAQNAMSIQVTSVALSLKVSWLSILGIGMYVASFLVYLSLVSKAELSYITPVSSAIVYILTMVVSYFVFHESFGLLKSIGLVLILGGIVLMNLKH